MAGKAKRPAANAVGDRDQVLPLLEHLARVGRRAYEGAMTPGGLRPRHLIALKMLSDKGPQTQQGMVESLSLDPSNVVGLLNELEERELIARRRDRADRRRHIVELSPLGEKELAAAYDRVSLVEDDLLRALTIAERATLYRLLQQAVDGVSPPCETDDPLTDQPVVPAVSRRSVKAPATARARS
jgi:DNA-binding MarR family transcriptional regulator